MSAPLPRAAAAGRRTSLVQQIAAANVDPVAANARRASIRRASTIRRQSLQTSKAAEPGPLGVDTNADMRLLRYNKNEHGDFSTLVEEFDDGEDIDTPSFMPEDMRCLALLAEEAMLETMTDFIHEHLSTLACFRLVVDHDVKALLEAERGAVQIVYGPMISSSTQGGDQQVAAMLAMELLGCVIQLDDPCSTYAHRADTASLHRLLNVHNILFASN